MTYKEITINIPLSVRLDDSDRGDLFAYVPELEGCSGYFGTEARARKELRKLAIAKVADLSKHDENSQRVALGCADDGIVLLVSFRCGEWGYDIIGNGRSYASSTFGGAESLDGMIELATNHAKQSWGGVAWTTRL